MPGYIEHPITTARYAMQPETYRKKEMESAAAPQAQVCKFLRKPFPGCYCRNISSMSIPKIISVCGGEFRLCPIYCREKGRNEIG